ncbi:hypothetical protein ASPTUDRAFT_454469 [Aspergillus tubingensis CBS 134.48]|uniref:Uncharacterized protein n=1 Tax=Aspergillus tubingensis (strain CBS 134.48) TaxID=767770 RepID=A0A1L9NAR5_ASPTC|nr:hypothetical protein ASPTUDRAFT_454469 [Aspergillus tubingensis CBS 134.48]
MDSFKSCCMTVCTESSGASLPLSLSPRRQTEPIHTAPTRTTVLSNCATSRDMRNSLSSSRRWMIPVSRVTPRVAVRDHPVGTQDKAASKLLLGGSFTYSTGDILGDIPPAYKEKYQLSTPIFADVVASCTAPIVLSTTPSILGFPSMRPFAIIDQH